MSASFRDTDVEEILHLMEQWQISEVHLTVEDSSLDIVRAMPVIETAPAEEALPIADTTAPEEYPRVEPVVIHAPVVGVFHLIRSGFPAGTPQTGDHVQAGQVIGSIELMHVPTDLASPASGTIAEILVEDGEGVQYNQPLMTIHPYEEVSEHEAGMLPPPPR